jgi:hypothetical protein
VLEQMGLAIAGLFDTLADQFVHVTRPAVAALGLEAEHVGEGRSGFDQFRRIPEHVNEPFVGELEPELGIEDGDSLGQAVQALVNQGREGRVFFGLFRIGDPLDAPTHECSPAPSSCCLGTYPG